MTGASRGPAILCTVAAVLIAMLVGPAGVSRADDPVVPGVSLTTTSGAPLQNGGTYGIGVVVVAHFDAPVEDRGAAEQQLAVSASPPVPAPGTGSTTIRRTGARRSTTSRALQSPSGRTRR